MLFLLRGSESIDGINNENNSLLTPTPLIPILNRTKESPARSRS